MAFDGRLFSVRYIHTDSTQPVCLEAGSNHNLEFGFPDVTAVNPQNPLFKFFNLGMVIQAEVQLSMHGSAGLR